MALENIPFSDGTAADILTTSSLFQYDGTNNNLLAGSPSSTFGSFAQQSAIIGGINNTIITTASDQLRNGCFVVRNSTINASLNSALMGGSSNTINIAEGSTIVGGFNNTINTYWANITAGDGNTINVGGHVSAIVGGQACTLSGSQSFCSGLQNVGSASQVVVLGTRMTVSGAGSFGYRDSTAGSSNLNTTNAFGVYVSNGVVFSNIASSQPNASAMLTLTSTTKGFLPPQMTTVQRDAIVTPAAGLIIYNTTTSKHQGYNGTTWNDFF